MLRQYLFVRKLGVHFIGAWQFILKNVAIIRILPNLHLRFTQRMWLVLGTGLFSADFQVHSVGGVEQISCVVNFLFQQVIISAIFWNIQIYLSQLRYTHLIGEGKQVILLRNRIKSGLEYFLFLHSTHTQDLSTLLRRNLLPHYVPVVQVNRDLVCFGRSDAFRFIRKVLAQQIGDARQARANLIDHLWLFLQTQIQRKGNSFKQLLLTQSQPNQQVGYQCEKCHTIAIRVQEWRHG